jgi:uncharacterized protein DUF6289
MSMRRSTKFTAIALAVLASATVYVASLTSAKAIVIVGPGVCAYYSDAKMKTVVGARGTGCCGSVINWGVVTPFKKCEQLYCTDQVCPN